MLALTRLVQIVLLLLLVRLLLRGVAVIVRAWRAGHAPSPQPARAPADLVRDQVCNTFLPRERALRAVVAGREQHFCSPSCRDKALVAVSRAS